MIIYCQDLLLFLFLGSGFVLDEEAFGGLGAEVDGAEIVEAMEGFEIGITDSFPSEDTFRFFRALCPPLHWKGGAARTEVRC